MDSNSNISVSIEYCQLQRSFSWSSKPRRAPTEYDAAFQRVKSSIEETFPDARVTGNESPPAGANGPTSVAPPSPAHTSSSLQGSAK